MTSFINLITDFYKKDECSKYYKFGKTLGTGSFATVKCAINKTDNSRWAIKCIDKGSLAPEDEEALQIEVQVLQMVKHKNIVHLKEVFDCSKTFYMVMEEMRGGELFDRIVEKEKYSEKEARIVIQKLALALKYCHDIGIVHRDLKPENLLFQTPDEDAEIKIADFGLAKLLKGDAVMQTACGTPGYVAPEILEGRLYGDAVDVWSLGVITYILLCGFPPFYDESNTVLFATIKAGKYDFPSPYWDEISAEVKDLISNMLVVNPKKRYTANDVLQHPWVKHEEVSSDKHLSHFTNEMRRYNAKRRFKAGVIATKMIRGLQNTKEQQQQSKGKTEEEQSLVKVLIENTEILPDLKTQIDQTDKLPEVKNKLEHIEKLQELKSKVEYSDKLPEVKPKVEYSEKLPEVKVKIEKVATGRKLDSSNGLENKDKERGNCVENNGINSLKSAAPISANGNNFFPSPDSTINKISEESKKKVSIVEQLQEIRFTASPPTDK